MHYQKTGCGPLLIYLPGMEGTGELFFRQEPALTSHFTVAKVRLRSEVPFTYDDLADDVLRIVEAEGQPRVTVVGESFGGTVAIAFALRYPERIEKLVLVNTFPYFRRRFRLRLATMLLPLGFTPVGSFIRKWIFMHVLQREGVDAEAAEKILECSFSHGYTASRQRLRLIAGLDARRELPRIQAPVLIVASERDKIVPSVREAKSMAQQLANAQIIILPNCGHTALLMRDFSLLSLLETQ